MIQNQNYNTPIISVIIPVYNAEKYLHQCIDSIINQTISEIEIICIDDESTDNSIKILEEYQLIDGRIRILTQNNNGAGSARNKGLAAAKGKYLSFLDADDFFMHNMLEKALDSAERNRSDIVIYQYKYYNTKLCKSSKLSYGIQTEYLQKNTTFSQIEKPEHILKITNPVVWNKLFRRDFIRRNNLTFMETKRSNDVYFTFASMILATKISWIQEALIYYRVGMQSNVQSNVQKYPLDSYLAQVTLIEKFKNTEQWASIEKEVLNSALNSCIYNIIRLRRLSKPAYITLLITLKNGGFERLGITNNNRNLFKNKWLYKQYLNIMNVREPNISSILNKTFLKHYTGGTSVGYILSYMWESRNNITLFFQKDGLYYFKNYFSDLHIRTYK